MMLPGILNDNLFNDFMEDFSFPSFSPFSAFPEVDKKLYGNHVGSLMRTDVKESDAGYEVEIDLPGFKKDEIRMQLNKGYLTVSAVKTLQEDEKDGEGKYVRRERYAGNMSRSFFVGEHVTEKDIHPKFEDGILSFSLPKEEKKEIEAKKHYISIEG